MVNIDGVVVEIMSLDLKERKDKAVILIRYRHIAGM